MTKKPTIPWWIDFGLKNWKPLVGLGAMLIGAIVFLATLNPRLSASEKKITELEKAAISNAAATALTSQLLSQLVQQQAPPPVLPWTFIKQEGDWQVFRDPDGLLQCCNGTVCDPKPLKGPCRS